MGVIYPVDVPGYRRGHYQMKSYLTSGQNSRIGASGNICQPQISGSHLVWSLSTWRHFLGMEIFTVRRLGTNKRYR